jgi:hypothetical protein
VRWVLTEAAQPAKTQPPFARFYAQCVHRRGTQIATVAVARKLLARSFHILNQVQATTTTSREGQPAGVRSLVSMRLQHGRLHDSSSPARTPNVMRILPAGEPEWVLVRPTPSTDAGLLVPRSCAGPRRRQGRSSSRALHLDPGSARQIGPPGEGSRA